MNSLLNNPLRSFLGSTKRIKSLPDRLNELVLKCDAVQIVPEHIKHDNVPAYKQS